MLQWLLWTNSSFLGGIMVELQQRATLLKSYETECYSVCFYLLQCETKAVEASKQALINIIRDDRFFLHQEHYRDECVRKAAARASIDVYRTAFL
jgi:hypothetical protein